MSKVKITINTDYIKAEMKRRNIASSNELAREIGISESMFHRVMNGSRNPGAKVIGLMLAYFGVNFEKIFREQLTKVNKIA